MQASMTTVEAGRLGPRGRLVVGDAGLQPQRFRADVDGLVGNRGRVFGPAEDVDDVDRDRERLSAKDRTARRAISVSRGLTGMTR